MPCHRLGRQICPRSHRRAAGSLPMWKLNRQRRLQLVVVTRTSPASSSPTQSSPPTVIAPSPSLAKSTAGSDGTSKISTEVSYITGVPTMISPEDATTSSMTVLASLMDRQVSSLTGISENSTKITSPTMGINASQLRKLFIPKLDKNVKWSMSPTMQTEIEILSRAQKKVTGGEIAVDEGEVCPCLRNFSRLLVLAKGPSARTFSWLQYSVQ
ncbi:hypothetical protein L210DRAFT_3547573 [Boletus edulis BED1]|uniref:Uncharacterized protein n=1 Tax=Boletus edulis BED1 TaxID=1328754 RepID=A0AAD4BQK4_BOLED|nr:hypothetical protein L210DRAFT_3547573 [Boletus edulis BED1]